MSQQTKYRCAHEHEGRKNQHHKRGEVITADQHKLVEHPEYWIPIPGDDVLKGLKADREKMVNRQNVIRK